MGLLLTRPSVGVERGKRGEDIKVWWEERGYKGEKGGGEGLDKEEVGGG